MKPSGNMALVTETGSGIGIAMARALLSNENRVVLCGHDRKRLDDAMAELPALRTYACDLTDASDRLKLRDLILTHFSDLNVLVHDAGLTEVQVRHDSMAAEELAAELTLELEMRVQITMLLLPLLMKRPEAAIVFVTTTLAPVSDSRQPAREVAREGLRSFTQSVRRLLGETRVAVIEVLSPVMQPVLSANDLRHLDPPALANVMLREMHRAHQPPPRRRWIAAAASRVFARTFLSEHQDNIR